MPRKYEQRARADSAAVTRRRVLDAMYRRLREAPAQPVSVDGVAQDAGVARSTVYLVFGSRAGLFDAFGEYLYERAGFHRIVEAVQDPDPREHLRRSLRAASEVYAAERDAARAVYSMGAVDPDAMAGVAQRLEASRAGGMDYLAGRLADAGLLQPGVSRREAADILFAVAGFDTFDLLFTGRGLAADEVAERLIHLAERSLLRNPAEAPGQAPG
ncbi:MAG TPA: TetR/AcrR family transcriptional regulator [Jiangellales bacterium]|nr:TetR/AcrR family transcriptional regulator [Jiangellales bacterium]